MESFQLPVEHPNYRFPDSLNIYWSKLRAAPERVYVDNDVEANKGKWRSVLGLPSTARIWLEIGCNGGHWLLAKAKETPGDFFLGLDWKYKQIFRAYEKAEKNKIMNTGFIRTYAERLPYVFAPSELDEIRLFFPDPWPRKKQFKKRYIQNTWLDQIAPLLKAGGSLEIRTDHPGYFQWIREHFEDSKLWDVKSVKEDLYSETPAAHLEPPAVTLFEKIYIKENRQIGRIEARPVIGSLV